MTEKLHTERFARMPHSFLCYSPPAEAPAPGPPPVLAARHVTFGCFNILAKVTPEVMSLWARILTAVPGSKLLMKDRSGTLGYPTRRRYVEDVFRYHGIEADRLELCGKEPDYGKHLACYGRVDVVLDPFPYNGTTTTCEALWMGVPVVTLAGKTHVSRVGMSVLSAIDLRSMVAATPDEYVNKAVALARDTDELAFLRETLRPRMSRSPLTDAKRYTRELEKLYRQMWVRWCAVAEREAGPVVSMRE
jgi:protein O-GlcNAc transferase